MPSSSTLNMCSCLWHFVHFMWLETLVATRMALSAARDACCWGACSCSTTGTITRNGGHDHRIREHHFANIQVTFFQTNTILATRTIHTTIFVRRAVFAAPKSIQATVTILENLHVILEKTPRDDIRSEVLPLLFNAFESTTIQVQVSAIESLNQYGISTCPSLNSLFSFIFVQSAALVAVANVYESLDEMSIRKMVLPKIKLVFEKNQSDLKIVVNVLQCIERTLDKLDKSQVSFAVYSTPTYKSTVMGRNRIDQNHSLTHQPLRITCDSHSPFFVYFSAYR